MRTVRAPATPVRSRIYEKIIWETVRAQAYASFAELVADVKVRCAELRVPYRHHEIDEALAAMGDKVTRELAPLERGGKTGSDSTVPPLTHDEAAAVLRHLHARPKVVPPARPVTPREADKRGAARVLAQAILDAVARCEEAERECDR
jgi:hypothetical protein